MLHKILNTNPKTRYSIKDIRNHPWYRRESVLTDPLPNQVNMITNLEEKTELDNEIIGNMESIGYDKARFITSIIERKFDTFYAMYHLLKQRKLQGITKGNLETMMAQKRSMPTTNTDTNTPPTIDNKENEQTLLMFKKFYIF